VLHSSLFLLNRVTRIGSSALRKSDPDLLSKTDQVVCCSLSKDAS
jgi:hypothetical protein